MFPSPDSYLRSLPNTVYTQMQGQDLLDKYCLPKNINYTQASQVRMLAIKQHRCQFQL